MINLTCLELINSRIDGRVHGHRHQTRRFGASGPRSKTGLEGASGSGIGHCSRKAVASELGHRLGVHASDVHVNVASTATARLRGALVFRRRLLEPHGRQGDQPRKRNDVGHKAAQFGIESLGEPPIVRRTCTRQIFAALLTPQGPQAQRSSSIAVLPVSVKDPTRKCFSRSRPSSASRAETVLEIRPHLNYAEAQEVRRDGGQAPQARARSCPPWDQSHDALDAGAARWGPTRRLLHTLLSIYKTTLCLTDARPSRRLLIVQRKTARGLG